ncbi:ABC-type dipeptide/oligopeptide/nickel transport system permease component [Bradyrhizobium sp. GM7.3]
MARFILVRLARAFLTIAIVVTFAFVVLRAAGDPARALLSPETPAEAVEAFRKAWGLDAPLWVQYLRYLFAVGHGDLGQ